MTTAPRASPIANWAKPPRTEAMTRSPHLQPLDAGVLQKAFVSEGGIQCGFCTPGMIIAARALLEENLPPQRPRSKRLSPATLRRCTGYEKIYQSVNKAIADGYCETFRKRENLCSGDMPEPTCEEDKNFCTAGLSRSLGNPG